MDLKHTTSRLAEYPGPDSEGSPLDVDFLPDETTFTLVPDASQGREAVAPSDDCRWRIVLFAGSVQLRALALEIWSDVTMGVNPGQPDSVDVDLSEWASYEMGVSRRHILLRPTRRKLFIMDLNSTNGTYINGLPLGVGWVYALRDGDLISLGKLDIRVHIEDGGVPTG